MAALGALLGALLVATVLLRDRAPRLRLAAWVLVGGAVLAAERLTAAEPPGVRMLAVIAALLLAMKAVVAAEDSGGLGLPRLLAWAAGWPGMRARAFATVGGPPRPGAGRLARRGALHLALGVALFLAARHAPSELAAAVFLLPALSLCLHFGLFDLLAAGWRRLGADADALFRAPLRATSLAEFWSRRWNLAFSEMTAQAVHRPASRAFGPAVGVMLSFLASGVFHEVAISVPVREGFGGPIAYFLLHGGLVLVERALAARGHPVDARTWVGRVWTATWLIAPLPILFHPPFVRAVLLPLLSR